MVGPTYLTGHKPDSLCLIQERYQASYFGFMAYTIEQPSLPFDCEVNVFFLWQVSITRPEETQRCLFQRNSALSSQLKSVKKAVNSHKCISTSNGSPSDDTAAFDCLKHGAYYNTGVFLRSL